MPKLPKELQKQKKAQMARVKGSSANKQGSTRAMRRQLQKQGIDGMEQVDATRVIIQCPDKQLVFENPQVIALKQQGMTVHQVIGEPEEHELSEIIDDFSTSETSDEIVENIEDEVENDETTISEADIKEQDIILVAAQAGVSENEAKTALEEADGDLARAILNLKTR
ncbi:MAG: hypothetical protein GY870_11100 [archaeon]|nr:hypothetical protein [archaeon]